MMDSVPTAPPEAAVPRRRRARIGLAAGTAVAAVLAMLAVCAVPLGPGTALVSGEAGSARIVAGPGLAWVLPAPLGTARRVDMRPHVAETGPRSVTLRSGERATLGIFLVWRVSTEPAAARLFTIATGNDPEQVATGLRDLASATLEAAAGGFAFGELLGRSGGQSGLATLESAMRATLEPKARALYGVTLLDVGVEQLGVAPAVLDATMAQARAETAADLARRNEAGLTEAARIRAEASRDARIAVANANVEAASIEAAARREAAEIDAKAYAADPQLYTLLRSLEALSGIVGTNTRLVLRTDAAPFSALVAGPPGGDTQK